MPVPNTMSDLATLASSNSPAGTEPIGNSLDNYIRAQASILRSTNALASSTVSAASTTDLGLADAESVQVTGTATITSLGTGFNGCRREARFAGACTLVHSSNIFLPNAANITTASGDVLSFRCIGIGQWLLTSVQASPLRYTPANKAGDTFTGAVSLSYSGPGLTLNNTTTGDNSRLVSSGGTLFVEGPVGSTVTVRGYTGGAANLSVAGTIAANSAITSGDAFIGPSYAVLATTGANVIVFRPNGNGSATGQAQIDAAGALTLNSGRKLSKITLSTSAPGVLADGELYLRY